jgi:hypothetical protein
VVNPEIMPDPTGSYRAEALHDFYESFRFSQGSAQVQRVHCDAYGSAAILGSRFFLQCTPPKWLTPGAGLVAAKRSYNRREYAITVRYDRNSPFC